MAVWTETEDTYSGLEANFTPTCYWHPDHLTVMELYDIKNLNFKLHDDDPDEPWSFATDVVVKCPHCGFHDTYGVAISREHHDRMWKKNEWLILTNTVKAYWNKRPLHVGAMILRWIKVRLKWKQPS